MDKKTVEIGRARIYADISRSLLLILTKLLLVVSLVNSDPVVLFKEFISCVMLYFLHLTKLQGKFCQVYYVKNVKLRTGLK